MVDREIRGDATRPGAEGGAWIEATPCAVNSPERFEREVFGNRRIANDANNPAIHLCLKLPEQRLKGVGVSLPEAFQQFHGAFLLGLTGAVSRLLQELVVRFAADDEKLGGQLGRFR
jgi:hypothetical protein